MVKKFITVLLLVAIMVTGFAGCSGGNGNEGGSEGSTVKNTEPVSGDPAKNPLGKYPETITFKTVKALDVGAGFPEGMDVTKNPYTDAIYEKLNVKMDLLWQSDSYDQKLTMAIVANDLPDIFWVDNYMTYRQLVNNDMLEPLTDAYNYCAGKYMKEVYQSYGDAIFQPFTEDGKLMALPGTYNGYQHSILWVRKDWLDIVDLPVPKTREDIVATAKAFMEKDPGGNGPGKTIGLNVQGYPIGGYGNLFGTEPIFASFGAYPRNWLLDGNSKVIYGSIQPEVKEGLAFVKSLYDQGIIDKQFPVRQFGDILGLCTAGRTGMFFFPWSFPYSAAEFIKNNPTGEWIAVNAPLDGNGKFNYITNRKDLNMMVVKKGYKNPEIIVKMLNVEFDMLRGFDAEGRKKLQPLFDAGTTWTAPLVTGRFNLEYNDAVIRVGQVVKNYIENGIAPSGENAHNASIAEEAKKYFDNPSQGTPAEWISYVSRYMASNVVNQPEANPIEAAFHYSTDTMATKWANLQKLEDEFYLQVITGEKPIDDFDKFAADWKKLGGDEIIAEIQEIVDSYKK